MASTANEIRFSDILLISAAPPRVSARPANRCRHSLLAELPRMIVTVVQVYGKNFPLYGVKQNRPYLRI